MQEFVEVERPPSPKGHLLVWSICGLYLKPPDFDDLSGEFALKSGWKVFFNPDIRQRFQDRHRSLWKSSEIQILQRESRSECTHHPRPSTKNRIYL